MWHFRAGSVGLLPQLMAAERALANARRENFVVLDGNGRLAAQWSEDFPQAACANTRVEMPAPRLETTLAAT